MEVSYVLIRKLLTEDKDAKNDNLKAVEDDTDVLVSADCEFVNVDIHDRVDVVAVNEHPRFGIPGVGIIT